METQLRSRNLSETKTYELATHEDLLTLMGMSVPAGRYIVFPAKDGRNSGCVAALELAALAVSAELGAGRSGLSGPGRCARGCLRL